MIQVHPTGCGRNNVLTHWYYYLTPQAMVGSFPPISREVRPIVRGSEHPAGPGVRRSSSPACLHPKISWQLATAARNERQVSVCALHIHRSTCLQKRPCLSPQPQPTYEDIRNYILHRQVSSRIRVQCEHRGSLTRVDARRRSEDMAMVSAVRPASHAINILLPRLRAGHFGR
jgi:hypothetical protein